VWSRRTQGKNNAQDAAVGPEAAEGFDELILAVNADAALKILGKNASWKEIQVLGNVKVWYFQSYELRMSIDLSFLVPL
jgi:predicted NAD/FAD-binding protein